MLVLFAIVICTIAYFSRHCTYYGDDLSCSLYHNGWFDSINPTNYNSAFKLHGGGCLCLFLTNIFNYNLPHFLGIHPADFMGIPHGIIKGIFLYLILLSITNFSNLFKKSKILYVLIFISIFLYFLYSITSINSFVIAFNHSFYRYIFPLLFFSYFWMYIYKNVFFNSIESRKQLLFASICGLIIGTSVEILFFSSVMLLFLIMLYKRFKLTKSFCIPAISLFISMIIFVSSQGFRQVASERGINNIQLNLDNILDFSKEFFQVCFINEWYIWILFIFFMCASFCITNNKYTYKKLLFPLLLQVSIITVMFSLILCGKSFYTQDEYWLSHPNIQVLYRILILYSTLIYFSFFAKFIKLKDNLSILMLMVFALTTLNFAHYIEILKEKSYWYNDSGILARTKKTNYVIDKIYRFYQIKEEKIQLPIELAQYQEPFIEFFLWSRDCKDIHNNYCNRGILNSEYYPKIYKDNSINKYYFSKSAINDFYKKGGSFTKEELENIKFQNLLDKKFVLKEDKEKIQIINIYPIF